MILLNKDKLVSHIKDQELKFTMLKCLDIVDNVLVSYDIKYTKFLNPYEITNLAAILRGIDGIGFHSDGGFEESERKVMYIYPDYYSENDVSSVVSMLKITGNFKYRDVSHRDYLGSILSLGIVRENVGDICVNSEGVYVFVLDSMKDYILYNLNKVSNVSVKVVLENKGEFKYEEADFEEVIFTVMSLRLDAIVASAFNLSREKSQSLIKNEYVKVDYEIITSNSKALNGNNIISVRGFGRFVYIGELGETKKNRVRVLIKKYRK